MTHAPLEDLPWPSSITPLWIIRLTQPKELKTPRHSTNSLRCTFLRQRTTGLYYHGLSRLLFQVRLHTVHKGLSDPICLYPRALTLLCIA